MYVYIYKYMFICVYIYCLPTQGGVDLCKRAPQVRQKALYIFANFSPRPTLMLLAHWLGGEVNEPKGYKCTGTFYDSLHAR